MVSSRACRVISDPQTLRARIIDAETMAGRLEYPGLTMNLSERRIVAMLLRDLADIGRRAFDPHARHDWSVIPREPDDESDAPGLFV